MKPIVFASLGAPFFAQYLANITGNEFCPNGSPQSRNTYDELYNKSSSTHNLFMVGLYWPTHKSTKNFYKRSRFDQHVVLFAGADIMDMYQMSPSTRDHLLTYLKKRRTIFATESPHMKEHIKNQFGIDTEVIYLPARHNYPTPPLPLPQQFTVGCYMPFYRRPFYGWPIIMQAIRLMPDVQFHFYSVLGYQPVPEELALKNLTCHPQPIDDIPNFVGRMSCGVRITAHDTYSMSAIEYNLGGRWFLNNHPMPYCIKLNYQPHPTEVVSVLRQVQSLNKLNDHGHNHYKQFHSAAYFIEELEKTYNQAGNK